MYAFVGTMQSGRNPVSLEKRAGIVSLIQTGTSADEAAALFGVCKKTVLRINKRWETTGSVRVLKRFGRPRATTEEQDNLILGKVDFLSEWYSIKP